MKFIWLLKVNLKGGCSKIHRKKVFFQLYIGSGDPLQTIVSRECATMGVIKLVKPVKTSSN